MTLEQMIAVANGNPRNVYHIFGQYSGAQHGYYSSRETFVHAVSVAAKLTDPYIFDRKGNNIHIPTKGNQNG